MAADNLTTQPDPEETLPASMEARGSSYGGYVNLSMKFDALAKDPTFDLNAEIAEVDMVGFNEFMQAYGNFDVKKGEFNLYTEFAAKNDSFGGYVKPLIKDLDIVQWEKEEGNVGQILWETVVAGGAEIIQNQKKDQVATKINIESTFEDPDINIWRAVSYILRNAFLQALYPSIDNTINIEKLEEKDKTFLEKLFSKNGKEKKGRTTDKQQKDNIKEANK